MFRASTFFTSSLPLVFLLLGPISHAAAERGFKNSEFTGLKATAGFQLWTDIDNDGKDDVFVSGGVAAASWNSGTGYFAGLFHNDGNGAFSQVTLPADAAGILATGDLNGNSLPDFVGNAGDDYFTRTLVLFTNQGGGAFQESTISDEALGYPQIADFNQDNHADILGVRYRLLTEPHEVGHFFILRNDGSGSFTPIDTGLSVPYLADVQVRLAWTDLDGDGIPDLILSYGLPPNYSNSIPTTIGTRVFLGRSDATFVETGFAFSSGDTWGAPIVRDVNGDGFPDVLMQWVGALNPATMPLTTLYMNDGHGNFTPGPTFDLPNSQAAEWGDYNHDGRLDLALMGNETVGESPNQYQVATFDIFRQNIDGSFTRLHVGTPFYAADQSQGDSGGAWHTCQMHWMDVDSDGWNDLAVNCEKFELDGNLVREVSTANYFRNVSTQSISAFTNNPGSVKLDGPVTRVLHDTYLGTYRFDDLPDGTYTLTPTTLGVEFTPAQKVVTIAGNSIDSVDFDSTALPVGVSINDEAKYTNSTHVVLSILPAASPGQTMQISNDGGFRHAQTVTISDASSVQQVNWDLGDGPQGRQTRIVYVRFNGDDQSYTDDIILDTTPPEVESARGTVTSSKARSLKSTRSVALRISAKDKLSGVKQIQIESNGKAAAWRPFKRALVVAKVSTSRLRVRVKDGAGNVSRWRNVQIRGR